MLFPLNYYHGIEYFKYIFTRDYYKSVVQNAIYRKSEHAITKIIMVQI